MQDMQDVIFKYAVVDIGANSVRMNIYDIDKRDGSFTVCAFARSMLGLAAYVKNGALDGDGQGKLFTVMREFLARANSYPCDKFSAFATASLRGLSNSEKICRDIKTGLGIDVEIISGETEASYDHAAICSRFPDAEKGVLIDMGGGSTEIVLFEKEKVTAMASLPIGCVMLMKKFTACSKKDPFPNKRELSAIRNYVKNTLMTHPEFQNVGGSAYLIGGTARAAAKLHTALFDGGALGDGYEFSGADLKKIADTAFRDIREDGGKWIREVVPDRVTSVISGLAAYEQIMMYMGLDRFVMSTAGVREGYLIGYLKQNFPQRTQES